MAPHRLPRGRARPDRSFARSPGRQHLDRRSRRADAWGAARVLVDAIERLVDERVAAKLAEHRNVKRWLTVAEAGSLLGCTSKAIYTRIDRGRIPEGAVRRMGRTVLIDRQKGLQAWNLPRPALSA